MRCLVTGASGFIGAALVRGLVARGHAVTAVLRSGSSTWRLGDSPVRIVRASLEDLFPVETELRARPADAVFHLAWRGVTADCRNSPEQILINAAGAIQLWRMARDTGCGAWIGLGSQAEYGPQTEYGPQNQLGPRAGRVLTEDLHPQPATAYGVAKLAVGLMTGKMSELAGMRHVWLRLLSAYGPGDDPAHMIPSVIASLLEGRRPAVTGGEQLWDYLYIDDLVDALCAVLELEVSGTFNLASGTVVSIRAVIESLRDLIDPSLGIGFGEVPYAADQPMRLTADIGRLRSATGWTAQTSLEEGLKRTVDWHRARLEPATSLAVAGHS